MKKFFTVLLIVLLLGGAIFGIKKVIDNKKEAKRIMEVKKGWYVEILTEYINVREEPNQYSYNPKDHPKVYQNEVYKVLDYNNSNSDFYWYKIEFKDGFTAWIANNRSGNYLKDYNSQIDIATPSIKYEEEVYHVVKIEDINYNHLIAWDDRDGYKITHTVYHELDPSQNKDQYWIKYTITDASGKHASKTQKIEFEIKPDESKVTNFIEYTKD